MGIIVQKFGGSSVADTNHLFNVCNHIIREYNEGNEVVVVVSAQGKTTDHLIKEESEITKRPNKREHDVLVSVGEQITISKLAMCLEKRGYKAISYTGWQLPILTNSIYGNAQIQSIDTSKIIDKLNSKYIVIVAGFQGIDNDQNITTLGRGGSDTTAVALAVALKATRCDIYTDVDGIYSGDPRIVENTVKIDTISYDEMLELAGSGAKVLHNRCVQIAKDYNMPVYVKSTFEKESTGTLVTSSDTLEHTCIKGIAKCDELVRITVVGKNNKIGRIYKLFSILANNNLNVDTIVQSFGEHIEKNISFTVKEKDLDETIELLNNYASELDILEIKQDKGLSKISIIGIGITNNLDITSNLFELLYENNINMHMITTSEIKISIVVNSNVADFLMQQIHEKFIV